MTDEKKYLHALTMLQCLHPSAFKKLSLYFCGDFSRAWHAKEAELVSAGLTNESAALIAEKRKTLVPDNEFERLRKEGIDAFTATDPEYPVLLKETPYAPLLLYVRGTLASDEFSLAIVGTRKPTAYGKEICEKITSGIASAGIPVVSGLALGIDGIAHTAAVKNNSRTIAVLGSGVDDASLYPSYHKPLAKKILETGGALISEFPPQTPALKHHFPQRNRIIAGISKGTVVIEAREKSGALITARLALEYGRDIFAVPGSVFSSASEGPHALLKEGAILVSGARDVLENYGIEQSLLSAHQEKTPSANILEARILEFLDAPLQFEALRENAGVDTPTLNAALSMLELKEHIKNLGNRTYIRKKL